MSLIRGKMPAVWQAKWIDPELEHDKEERQPASVLSRRFTVESTENAVKSFQRYNSLQVDGVAGPATLRTLLQGAYPFGS